MGFFFLLQHQPDLLWALDLAYCRELQVSCYTITAPTLITETEYSTIKQFTIHKL